jgi:hypothetical protein
VKKIIFKFALILWAITTVLCLNIVHSAHAANIPAIFVPSEFDQDNLDKWKDIENNIINAQPDDVITLLVQGYGGEVLMLNEIVTTIEAGQARGVIINMILIGPAKSAHASLLCAADNLSINDGGSAMFHAGAYIHTMIFGLIEYRDTKVGAADAILRDNLVAKCKDSGLLTDQDIYQINLGQDVTLYLKNNQLARIYEHDSAGPEFVSKEQIKLGILGLCGILLLVMIKRI